VGCAEEQDIQGNLAGRVTGIRVRVGYVGVMSSGRAIIDKAEFWSVAMPAVKVVGRGFGETCYRKPMLSDIGSRTVCAMDKCLSIKG
jgi:hypothetical protein